MTNNIAQQFQDILQKKFHFNEFRPGQLEALTLLMTQGRLLCIQPTGYGKSLLYQLPSVVLEGVTLVISPLLALMRDQLTQLKNRFDIAAASWNSDQSDEENRAAQQAALMGKVKILFVSPEQLDNIERFEFLLRLPISLLVVDEAHCISTWGHDFRPSYRQIIKLTHELVRKNVDLKILGLTATANHQTEVDIKKQLSSKHQDILVHREKMHRANIRLSVLHTAGPAVKLATLYELLKNLNGSGLIYCATRENTEIVAAFLREQGVNAVAYHAGIEPHLKRTIQEDFLHDKYPVIAATNALGMGIDKANIRFIFHYDFPGSITAYYQEVGRCGRDGLPAEGILLFDPADRKIQDYFIEAAQPTTEHFSGVIEAIRSSPTLPNLSMLKRLTGLHPTKLSVVLSELVEQAFVKKILINRSQVYQVTEKHGKPDLLRYVTQFKTRTLELKAMQDYAEQTSGCLMATLCEALGDVNANVCGQCSRCAESFFQVVQDKNTIFTILSWLSRRTVSISLNKKIKNIIPGLAVLDGKLRSPDFVSFMRERASSSITKLGISDNLLELIKDCLTDFANHHKLSCIIPIPSRTWGARNVLMNMMSNLLKIPVMFDLLHWEQLPESRQGELLNNDQRQHNVSQKMRMGTDKIIPSGAILLIDDYTGSGATFDEAARALREGDIRNAIFPFAIAAVKWRLGQKGMI